MRRMWPVLQLVIGAAVLVALVWRLGAHAVVDGLRAIDAGSVLAALAIGLVTTACSAWRWSIVARALGMRLSLPAAVADCYQALFLNSVLPAGILGDVHRAVSQGRQAGDVGRGVRAVVLERLAGQVVLVVVAVGVLFAQPAVLHTLSAVVPGAGWSRPLLVAAVLAAVAAALAWRLRARLRPRLGTVVADARAVLRPGIWPGVLALSVVALAGYLAMFVVAARAAGSTATIAALLPVLVLALLVMSLPINIGGWGPREAVAAVGFGAAGLGATQGLSAAVVYGVLGLIACLPGAAVLLLRRRRGRGVTGTRRTTAPDSPGVRVLSLPTQATGGRRLPTPCTPQGHGSADDDGRRRDGRPARSAA